MTITDFLNSHSLYMEFKIIEVLPTHPEGHGEYSKRIEISISSTEPHSETTSHREGQMGFPKFQASGINVLATLTELLSHPMIKVDRMDSMVPYTVLFEELPAFSPEELQSFADFLIDTKFKGQWK